MMFLDCPACVDQDGTVRCGLPAEVRCRFTMHSTDGVLESAMIRCPADHHFSGPSDLSHRTARTSTIRALPEPVPAPGVTASSAAMTVATAAGPHSGIPRRARAEGPPPEHRSRLLSGPSCPPVDHCHAPAPQGQRIPSPGASRHRRRANAVPARRPCYPHRARNSLRDAHRRALAGHLADDPGAGMGSPWNQ